jgi:hypothetical protein
LRYFGNRLEGVYLKIEQHRIDEKYFDRVQISSEVSTRNSENWIEKLPSIEKWIIEQTTICKKVLRLRSYLYLKIPWIETSLVWDHLLSKNDFCLVPGNNQWITRRDYLGSDGYLIENRKEVFETKKQIYDQWVRVSLPLGYFAEKIYLEAFDSAGYSPKKLNLPLPSNSEARIGIDVYGEKDNLAVGVQVKNVTSEVFTDPSAIYNPRKIYRDLARQFEYCSAKGIVPILIAPFVDKRFYNFSKRYNGLHCQTYLQLFSPECSELCYDVKNTLGFGNVKVVTEATQRVRDWIENIPQMWNKRYAK